MATTQFQGRATLPATAQPLAFGSFVAYHRVALTTAVILNAALTNDSSRLTVVIHHFTVELLWNDSEFDWLYDPAEIVPSASFYTYAGTLLAYPRDT
jgi:hypothetical protein